jgi:hypothetical protein
MIEAHGNSPAITKRADDIAQFRQLGLLFDFGFLLILNSDDLDRSSNHTRQVTIDAAHAFIKILDGDGFFGFPVHFLILIGSLISFEKFGVR